jgi:MFS transporter, DHA2 family, glioxin efflux transporter
MFFFGGAYLTVLYYLPFFFQSEIFPILFIGTWQQRADVGPGILGSSPIGSGVRMLAFIVPMMLAT